MIRLLKLKRTVFALMAILAITVSELSAQTVTETSRQTPPDYKHSNTRFGNYPGTYFTPRIEWGRPLATGRLNLLAFIPLRAARESVELASRLDAKIDMVTTSFPDNWWVGWKRSGPSFYDDIPTEQALNERARLLLSPAYNHNAIIIGKIKWSVIPEDIRRRILEKVKGGTALIFVSPWDVDADLQKSMKLAAGANPLAESIRATVPLAKLPLDRDLTPSVYFPAKRIGPLEIRTGKLGEGNVVFLQYNDPVLANRQLGLTPFIKPLVEDDEQLFYNYYFSILSKALIHAAGRTSGANVRPDSVTVEISRDQLPAAPVTFRVTFENRVLPGTVINYEIRDQLNHVTAKGEKEIAQADGDLALAPHFNMLRRGLYMVDVWIKRRGMVLDWASAAVTVTDKSYLKSVVADKEFFGRDEKITGRITLYEPVPPGHKVVAELWDTYDRLEQRVALQGSETKFGFDRIQYPLSRAYRIVCKVESGDFVMDERQTWTGLPSNEFDEFQFLVWSSIGCSTRINKTYMTLFKEYGITGYVELVFNDKPLMEMVTDSADFLARNNLKAWALCGQIAGFIVDEKYAGRSRIGDFQKETWKAGVREWYLPRIEAYQRYGTLAYAIDSESHFESNEALWDNPTALRDYRIYLQARYGDIDNLNKIWSSAFGSVEDIRFISFMDAKTGRQSTRWLEQILYKKDRFNSVQEYTANLVRQLVPGGRVGLDLTQESYDIPRMAKFTDGFIQSHLEHFDKGKERVNAGNWVGFYQGQQSEWHMRTQPWESLFRGGNALAWWYAMNTFTKDLSEPYLCFKQAAEEVHAIHSGFDRLLMSSDKRIDPILILWSQNSEIAGVYNPLGTTWSGARDNFINMLRRTGLDYQCVGEDFVEDELQFSDQQRVLILPASQSISRKGVEQIKAFASAGGLVIADYKPAGMDEYLRPYGDDPKASNTAATFETCPRCKGEKIVHLGGAGDPLGACPRCGGTGMAVTGDAVAMNSALTDLFHFEEKGVKQYGQGYGLFLAGAPAQDEWLAIRGTLVRHGGIKGDIEVLDILGNTRTDLRTYVFDNGPAMFVGVLPDQTIADPPGEEFILKTDKKMYIYNVRMHSYLGFSDSVVAGILPAQAKLFALLPARIDGLALESRKTEYRPGEVVMLDIKTMPDAFQDVALAVRLEVLNDNRVIPAYTKKLAVKGAASHPVPLALNQEEGAYTLRLTEIISGHQQEMTIAVSE